MPPRTKKLLECPFCFRFVKQVKSDKCPNCGTIVGNGPAPKQFQEKEPEDYNPSTDPDFNKYKEARLPIGQSVFRKII